MEMRIRIGVALLAGLAVPSRAHADHQGMEMGAAPAEESSFGAGISLVAAQFDTTFYVGDYEGVVPSVRWSKGRYSASASLPVYRIEENGFSVRGLGDLVVQGSAGLVDIPSGTAGFMLAVSIPTTDGMNGLFGMDHLMVMPMAWGMWMLGHTTLSVSGGYSRAITDLGQHVHGAMPLVEPMNMSEITFGGGVDFAITHHLHTGARLSGALPVAVTGVDRLVGAVRVGWGTRRIETAAELQVGFAGDPFTVRGVVETALRF